MIRKNWAAILGMGAAGLVATTLATADTLDDRWYIAPSVSGIRTDDSRDADNGYGAQAAVGKPVTEFWNIELEGLYDKFDRDAGGSFKQRGLTLDALYLFTGRHITAPYAVVGAGVMRTTVPGQKSTNPLAEIGIGLMHQFTDYGLAFRGDIRYRHDRDDNSVAGTDNFNDVVVNLGLSIPLGAKAMVAAAPVVAAPAIVKPAPVAPVVVAPKDSDGDGVVDSQDRCPNSPAGAKVNAQGCELDSDGDGVVDSQDRCPNSPAGAKVNAQGCELDSDADGVVDSQDRCPNSPAGAKVNAQGCELDSDADGVVDSADRCPNSKPGAKVDASGCVIPEVITLKGVNFANDSAELNAESKRILDEVANTLRSRPNINVEVAGYTDNAGNVTHNEGLSQRRANAVQGYLISKGVEAKNLSAKGYGPANPAADNATAAGRAENRRVELHIVEQ